ncbi:MAG: hypothetical protein PVI82_07795 [Desulfobacterales bacterium]|jgi:hypothetical protein
MTDSKEALHWVAKVDRRLGGDRRQFSYTVYIPERRCGKDRRIRKSKEKTYLLNTEDNGTMTAEEAHLKKY